MELVITAGLHITVLQNALLNNKFQVRVNCCVETSVLNKT